MAFLFDSLGIDLGIIDDSAAIFERMAEKSDHCLVAYSGGKDSMVVLDYAVRYFKRVDAFFMCIVPGLDVLQGPIEQAERRYGIKVRQYPHWLASRIIQVFFCQCVKCGTVGNFPIGFNGCDAIMLAMRFESPFFGGANFYPDCFVTVNQSNEIARRGKTDCAENVETSLEQVGTNL